MKVKTNIKAGFLGSIALLTVITVAAPPHTLAISKCFDYVYYRITGQDSNTIDVNGLRYELELEKGYVLVDRLVPGKYPDESQRIKDGDVLIFDNAHTGIVGLTMCGMVDNFVMKVRNIQGTNPNETYTPAQVLSRQPPAFDDVRHLPLLKTQTLQEIRDGYYAPDPANPAGPWRLYAPYKNSTIEVWRPGVQVTEDWVPQDQGGFAGLTGLTRFGPIVNGTFVLDSDPTWQANNPAWRLSSAYFSFSKGRSVQLFLATNKANASGFVGFSDPDKGGAWSGWLPAY